MRNIRTCWWGLPITCTGFHEDNDEEPALLLTRNFLYYLCRISGWWWGTRAVVDEELPILPGLEFMMMMWNPRCRWQGTSYITWAGIHDDDVESALSLTRNFLYYLCWISWWWWGTRAVGNEEHPLLPVLDSMMRKIRRPRIRCIHSFHEYQSENYCTVQFVYCCSPIGSKHVCFRLFW